MIKKGITYVLIVVLSLFLIYSVTVEVRAGEVEGYSLESFDAELPGNLPTLGLDKVKDPVTLVEKVLLNYIINPIFFISGGVAIVMIMYSSSRLITARGEEEGITAAKKTLIWSLVGLGLVILAFTIVSNLAKIILKVV